MGRELKVEEWEPPARAAPPAGLAELDRRHRRLALALAAVYVAWYMALWLLAGYAPGLMRMRVGGPFTLSAVLAFSQFPAAALAVWAWSRLAARRLDPLARSVREGLQGRRP